MCAEQQGRDLYDLLEEELSLTSCGSNGLLFLPYLLGERSPRWNPDAKGGFIGLKMEHERKDMMRAVQEGVAMNLSLILDVFRAHGTSIDEMVVIGGGAKSECWRQILADVYQLRILKPDYMDEATSIGAAITAGVGVGVFQDFDVIQQFLSIEEQVEPMREHSVIYKDIKVLFDEAYEALTPLFQKLSAYKK